jgi:predicted Fe-Mo cluster-binding NifX family protein
MSDDFTTNTVHHIERQLKKGPLEGPDPSARLAQDVTLLQKYDNSHGRNFQDDLKALNEQLHKDGYLPGLEITEDGKSFALHTSDGSRYTAPNDGHTTNTRDNHGTGNQPAGNKDVYEQARDQTAADAKHELDSVTDIFSKEFDKWGQGASAIRHSLLATVDLLSADPGRAAQDFGEASKAVKQGFQDVGDQLSDSWEAIKGVAILPKDAVVQAGAGVVREGQDVLTVAGDGRDTVQGVMRAGVNFITGDPAAAGKDVEQAVNGVKNGVKDSWKTVTDGFESTLGI